MNKELSPLEALLLLEHDNYYCNLGREKELNIIETALKEYEELKKLKLLPYPKVNDKEYRISVIKRLQALEIIKELPEEEKQILMNAVYTYRKSEEEYDLLKEELE